MDIRSPEEREDHYRDSFLNKTVKELKFYQANDHYLELAENQTWVLDIGVTISFADGQHLTFGWNEDMELHRLAEVPMTEHNSLDNLYHPPVAEAPLISRLRDKTLTNLQFSWNWFEDFDGNREYVPNAMILTFDNAYDLILAAMHWQPNDDAISLVGYDIEGEIMISVDPAMLDVLNAME